MFPGTCEVDTLFRIFEYMGTPEEADVTHRPTRSVTDRPLNLPTAPQWSGLSLLPEYGTFKFPRFKGTKMPEMLYGPEATDLLHRMLELDPKRRINALDAVRHPYFDSLAPEERLKFN
jgi:serine/threonine protein kinase